MVPLWTLVFLALYHRSESASERTRVTLAKLQANWDPGSGWRFLSAKAGWEINSETGSGTMGLGVGSDISTLEPVGPTGMTQIMTVPSEEGSWIS